jgi:hypothetical protein
VVSKKLMNCQKIKQFSEAIMNKCFCHLRFLSTVIRQLVHKKRVWNAACVFLSLSLFNFVLYINFQ